MYHVFMYVVNLRYCCRMMMRLSNSERLETVAPSVKDGGHLWVWSVGAWSGLLEDCGQDNENPLWTRI